MKHYGYAIVDSKGTPWFDSDGNDYVTSQDIQEVSLVAKWMTEQNYPEGPFRIVHLMFEEIDEQ